MTQAEAMREQLMAEDLDQVIDAIPEAMRSGRKEFPDGSALVMVTKGCCLGWWPTTDPHARYVQKET